MTELLVNWTEVERLNYRIKEVMSSITPKLVKKFK